METNNKKKTLNGLPFYALTFLTALLFELYWILNGPTDYFMLVGIGIIIIITGYLTIDSIMKARADELAARQQQNDTIVKAQKAIYLATKKTAKETEKIREQNMKTLEVLIAGMVSSQKELVNLISSKSGASSAQLVTGDSSDMTDLIDKLSQSNEKLAKQVQDAMTIDELVKSNAELVKSVQGMFTGAPAEPVADEAIADETDTNETGIDEFIEEFEELDMEDGLVVDTLVDSVEDFPTVAEEMISDEDASAGDDSSVAEAVTTDDNIATDDDVTTESDERDPNAPLSEEEIAALFASL